MDKIKQEHQEIYSKLEHLLLELTKVKNQRNDEHLLNTTQELLEYIKWLLESHFKEEEEELFPNISNASSDKIIRLLNDHKEIEDKYQKVLTAYENFDSTQDYKESLLYPAYNLIATINHHAQREDQFLDSVSQEVSAH